MTDHTTLSDADSIELEGFYDASYAQDWAEPAEHIDIDRWSKYGHDRLYINEGIAKADKYDLYVDLQTHEICSNNETKHSGGSVEIEGDTATITIEISGGKHEHEITVSLEGDDFETVDDENDEDSEDESEAEDNDTLSAPSGGASAPVADGGGEYEAPTTEQFEMGQKEEIVQHRDDDGNLYAGIEYHSLEDGLHPDVPHYIVSVGDVATIILNIGIARPEFEENWEGGSWDGFLDQYPYDEIGMDVGELLIWQRPHDEEKSYVRNRYTLDGDRAVEADMTVEELARDLLKTMIGDSEHSLPDDDDNDPEPMTDGGEDATDGDDEPMLVRETREVSVGSFGGTCDRHAWVPDDRGSWTERDELKYEALRTVTRSEYAEIPLAEDRDRVPLRGHFSDRLESDPLFERHWLRMQVREEIEDVDAYVDDHLAFETVDRGESGEGEGHEVFAIVDVTDEQTDETARFRCRNAVDIGYQVFAVDDDVSDRLEALGEIALTTYKPIKGGHRQFDWE